MSFDALEYSVSRGRPVRLYEFQRGSMRWRYTNADRDLMYQTQTYRGIAISDGGVRVSGSASSDVFEVEVPASLELVTMYRALPPSTEIGIVVRDLHWQDDEANVEYVGSIASVGRPNNGACKLRCQTLAFSMEQPGLRLGWERGCTYHLYDANCGVLRESYRVTAVLQSVTGNTIRSPAFALFPPLYFSGGYVEWELASGVFETREVGHHEGDLLVLSSADGLLPTMRVNTYPGCARIATVCNEKFGNIPNYGGYSSMPGRSPFDGQQVF